MRRLARTAGLAAGSALLATCAFAQEGDAERGRLLALDSCARCHAVAATGDSPLAEAPPFRELHERYPVEHLAEALVEGIVTGHPGMSEFRLAPEQAEDLIAYLRSLE